MKPIKVILGGGNGLCGSHLSRHLLDRGYEVVILDDLSESYIENLDVRAKFYLCDIRNNKLVNQIFEIERPNYVYGMQAHAAECLSPFTRHDCYSNNLLTEISLINASINYGVEKIIGFSSMAVYGSQETPFTEKMPLQPIDSYGAAKKTLELDHELAKIQHNLDYSIVRPHNFQGPYVNMWSKYRNFVGIFIRKVLNGENILVYGDGKSRRALSDVKFLCEPLERLLYTNLKTVNIGADKPYEVIEIAKIIQKIGEKDGKRVDIEHAEPRHEVKEAFCEHFLAKDKLGFKDETDVEKLCYEIYQWAKKQPNRPVKYMEYEVTKGIYEYWK